MSKVQLTSSMRSNLLSLQNTTKLQGITQERLATGLKVNSAIDNPSAYYTAQSLSNRASDLSALLDSMGQAIECVKAATEGLTAALICLEQAAAVAERSLSINFDDEKKGIYDDYIAQGYKEITSVMSASEIQDLLIDDAKLILKDDIIISEGLEITSANVTIYGNGKSLQVNGDNKVAITVKGKDSSLDISNLKININGDNTCGIMATESGHISIDNLDNITAIGSSAQKYYYRNEDLFLGKEYTSEIYSQLCSIGDINDTAVDYTIKYHAEGVNSSDEYFGQGKWYMGAIGEWCDLYGYTYADVGTKGTTGAKGDVIETVNKTIELLGDDATSLKDNYWSSTEYHSNTVWGFVPSAGARGTGIKYNYNYVRCFNYVENCFSADDEKPQIGYVMYSDRTWSSAEDYETQKENGKTAVGIIFDVDTVNNGVKIIALEDAYESAVTMGGWGTDFQNVPNYSSLTSLKDTGDIIVTYKSTKQDYSQANLAKQFTAILTEFDNIISDSSYKGKNLLNGDSLSVTFNENNTHKLTVNGIHLKSKNLGISKLDWSSIADVEQSMREINLAISQIRNFQNKLGNNYYFITTRQNFTQNLINVLEEGADKLTLADMSEESANMLSLQTRQQLATNALSLSSQASQSILKFF